MTSPRVTDVTFTDAPRAEAASGLIGWVSFAIDGTLRLDGVAVRRTREGRLALSYPARTDRAGQRHPYLRPLDDDARRALERQVLAALPGLAAEEAHP